MTSANKVQHALVAASGVLTGVFGWIVMGEEFAAPAMVLLGALILRAGYLYWLTAPLIDTSARVRKLGSRALWFSLCGAAAVGEGALVVSILGPDTVFGRFGREGLSKLLVSVLTNLDPGAHAVGPIVAVEHNNIISESLWLGPERSHACVLIYAWAAMLIHALLVRSELRRISRHALFLLLSWITAKVLFVEIILSALTQDRWQQSLVLGHDHVWGPVALMLILSVFLAPRGAGDAPTRRPRFSTGVLVVLSAALMVAAFSPGLLPTSARGRVLIDDSHCKGWQPASPVFDENWTAANAPYNFSTAAELLGHYFDVRVNESIALDRVDLDDFDVLILKIPERNYTRSEIQALLAYVDHGGGLLLLGDHTDLSRSATILNSVGERFGIHIADDSIVCREGATKPDWRRKPWTRPKWGFSVDEISLLTAASIQVNGRGALYGRADRSFSDIGQPDAFSHFGNMAIDGGEPTGPVAPIGLSISGNGRVAAFADGTTLTSFAICRNNRFEMLMSLVTWLNARDHPHVALRLVLLLSAALLGLTAARSWRGPIAGLYPLIGLGALCGLVAAEWYAKPPDPVAVHPLERVAFLGLGGTYALPDTIGATNIEMRYAMDTGFTSVFRLGLEPYWLVSLKEMRPNTKVLVLFNPGGEWDAERCRAILEYMENGGSFLLFHCTAYQHEPAVGVIRSMVEGAAARSTWSPIKLGDGRVSGREIRVGKGKHIEAGDSCFFSRERMGHCFQPLVGKYGSLVTSFLDLVRAATPCERPAIIRCEPGTVGGQR